MTMEEMRRLDQMARQWDEQAHAHLMQLHGADPSGGYNPHSVPPREHYGDGVIRGKAPMRPGEYVVPQYGQRPSPMDVQRFIASQGGNPYRAQLAAVTNETRANRSQPPALPAPTIGAPVGNAQTVAQRLFEQAKMQQDRALQENLKRYDEGHGELSDVRTRNQERVGNWGVVEEELNKERALAALGEQTAQLQAGGILNSNVLPAFQQRNARDLALLQQGVSERRDARASEYDTRDTGNLVGFVERRNDIGPDTTQLMQLALQHARAGGDEQNRQLQGQVESLRARLAQGRQPLQGIPNGGVSPAAAQAMAASMQAGFMSGIPQFGVRMRPGITANRYPTRRGGPIDELTDEQLAARALKYKKNRGRMLPNYIRPRRQLQLPSGPPASSGPMYA